MSITVKSCSVEGCIKLGKKKPDGTRHLIRGLCGMHYKRLGLYGDPTLKKKDIVPYRITPENRAYYGMIRRCNSTKHKNFKYYGGRGIKVCDRWLEPNGKGYDNFLEDMGQRPSSDHSLDRINNEGDYEPNNCRWADDIQQNNNTRKNVYITSSGKTMTATQWERELGLTGGIIASRIRMGWSGDRVLAKAWSTPRSSHPTPAR